MRDVHRLIADSVFLSDRFDAMVERVMARKAEPTGREVAIVGAGPTGLACAYYLALLGHTVTVYDSRPEAGGMLRYALPEYRLPKTVLDKEIELIERLGVKFQFNVTVGADIDAQRSRPPVRRGLPLDRHVEGGVGLPARHRAHGRHPRAAVPRGRRAEGEGSGRQEGRGHRRRQRGDRLRAHGAPPRRGRDDRLPPRAQGHAGDPGGDRGRRARGREARCSSPRRTASSATRPARCARSRSSRRSSASSTPRAAAGRSPPTRSSASSATP